MTQFRQNLKNMQGDGSLSNEGATRILALYADALGEIVDVLRSQVAEREQMDPEDTRLYTLALRRTIDLIEEEANGKDS